MELFSTDVERNRRKKKEKHFTLAFRIMVGFTIATFILLCLLIRTENARIMHAALIGTLMVSGWICIVLHLLGVQETRVELRHLDMLNSSEPKIMEGRMALENGIVQIPKSIRIRKLVLDTEGEEPERLNLDEKWVSRMPPDGTRVRLAVVHSYIAGIEVLEESDRKTIQKTFRGSAKLHRAAVLFPLLGIWALASVFFGSFVFYQLRDTDPAHKITVYMDGSTMNEDALAARLEKELGGAVQMVQIHPFQYFMFGSEALMGGDLLIIPDSALEQFGKWTAEEEESYIVFDPAAGVCIAGDTFLYSKAEKPEIYRLYIGAKSPHLNDGLARKTAAILISLDQMK